MKIDALILSGGHRNVARRLGRPTKSMIKYNGCTALDSVIKAVVGAPCVNSVVVIGPGEIAPSVQNWDMKPKPVFWVNSPDGFSMFQNLIWAYKHLLKVSDPSQEREIFFACSDIPFITSDTVSDFVSQFAPSEFTAVAPLVSLSSCREIEQRLGMQIPSVNDHLPISLDGELYHLGNLGLFQPDKLTKYWLDILCLSRDARESTSVLQSLFHPSRIKLIYHLFFGFLKQNKSKELRQFLTFIYQLLNWVASGHFYKKNKEDKAREYSSKVDSDFLFRRFFPGFGLNISLVRFDRPEVFIDFDTNVDVEFLEHHYEELKQSFLNDALK